MDYFYISIFIGMIVCLWFADIYYLVRNHMVYEFRINMLFDDYDKYIYYQNKGITYSYMMRKWWVWPLSRFYK